jgi:acetyl esterase/lipase
LALTADATGYVPEYRRAPEDPFPSAVDDAMHAYLLLHVGADEVLLGDAVALAREASHAGSDVTLRVWARMVHIFPWIHSHLQAGRSAIEEAGKWIGDVMARQ